MTDPTHPAYGLWPSPITPSALGRAQSLSDVQWDHSGALVWLERRAGRGVLVCQPPDGSAFTTPSGRSLPMMRSSLSWTHSRGSIAGRAGG